MIRALRQPDLRKTYERYIRPLLLTATVFYFVFHTISGERGVYALLRENRKLEVLKTELAEVSAKRKEIDHRVHLMSANSLDLDMLDEQSRSMLGTAHADELMIPYSPAKADNH